MADELNNDAPIIDGGEATEQEALLASQLATIGDNPQEEPGAGTTADAGADPAPAADVAAADAAAPPAAAPAAAAAPAPAPPAAVPPPPEPPRDFDADVAENERKFNDGEIDGDEYQKTLRALTKEEGQFAARLEIYNDRLQSAERLAVTQFNEAALAWEKTHADFMENPLRRQQMQLAVNTIAQEQPNLSPDGLFAEAARVVFEAFGYTPPAAAVDAGDAAAAAVAAALKARTRPGAPLTLGSAPAAGAIERASGNANFAALDALDIDALESALARMSAADRDAYLRDSPGSTATGR